MVEDSEAPPEVKEEEMKKPKYFTLKKDLPIYKAGDVFTLMGGNLYKDIGEQVPICIYSHAQLEKFPNILKDWFEEIPDRVKMVWNLEDGDICYEAFVEYTGEICIRKMVWRDTEPQRTMRTYNALHLTYEEAENYTRQQHAIAVLTKDTKGFKPDWNDGATKYGVYYDYSEHRLDIESYCWCCVHSGPWFRSYRDAAESIEKHEKEWRIYLGVEENTEKWLKTN